MTAARSVTLALVILISAVLLVGIWLQFVSAAPLPDDWSGASTAYQRAEIPVSLALIVLLQFLFAWISRGPAASSVNPAARDGGGSRRNAWKKVWTRLFVSFCWTLTLAIFLFVVLIFVSDV